MARERTKISSTGKTLRSNNIYELRITNYDLKSPLTKGDLGGCLNCTTHPQDGCPEIVNRKFIQGFTMVELLVVLFLIGLMFSIAIPSFIHTVEALKFKATARQIVSTLKFARNTAVFKQRSQTVGFDIDNDLYYLEGQRVDGDEEFLSQGMKTVKLPSDVSIESVEMVKDRIESGKGNILFYPDGSSSSGAIIVNNKRTKEGFRIAVDIFTGLTEVTFYSVSE